MATATVSALTKRPNLLSRFFIGIGGPVVCVVSAAGSLACFCLLILRQLPMPIRLRHLMPCFYRVGVLSLPVIGITGMFIGMVLAVQSYDQFAAMHLESHLGAVVNASLVRELGPVLAALMLAGRVGSAIAAEIGTMRVTEQIDALDALGADPVRYLILPRFWACFLLIPLLTVMADACGIVGGWALLTMVFNVNNYEYWRHSIDFIISFDIISGLIKSLFFGAGIAVISCHRGFHAKAGAEGVGRAATEAFVYSFILILGLDFVLGVVLNELYFTFFPRPSSLL